MRHSKKCRVTVMNTCDRTSEQRARGSKSDTSMYAVRVCIHSPVHGRFTAGGASKAGFTITRGQGTGVQEEFRGQAVHLPLHPAVQAVQPGGASCCTLTICSHFCAHIEKVHTIFLASP